MKLTYFGHACFALQLEDVTLVIDPFDESVRYAPCTQSCDAALVSHDHFDHNHTASLTGDFVTIASAGSFQQGKVHITALPCYHDKHQGALRGKNLIFIMEGEGLRIAHLGDLGHMPDEALAQSLRDLDLMLIPIGGTYTIDTPEAEELIRRLNPRCAVAMHYRTEDYDCDMATSAAFEADMKAVRMPRELEICRENLGQLPGIMIMNYK